MSTIARHRLSILILFLGFGMGFFSAHLTGNKEVGQFAIREYDQRYEFIRPLLICQAREDEETSEFKSLEREVNKIILAAQKQKKLTTASVYFRDLDSGRWVGINETENYTPASLLKVPIMMAYFKKSETDLDTLQARYAYVRPPADDDPLVQQPLLISDRNYSALDLIRGMIIQSDNSAMRILQAQVHQPSLDETYNALEIPNPNYSEDAPYQLSAKKYGLFFRVLYNGTFLNRASSNQALGILAESEFNLGIRAGIPAEIKVAHKYGVRGLTDEFGTHVVEQSDCGIVYNPGSPFLLCIMSRGNDAYILSDVIRQISEAIFRVIASNP